MDYASVFHIGTAMNTSGVKIWQGLGIKPFCTGYLEVRKATLQSEVERRVCRITVSIMNIALS